MKSKCFLPHVNIARGIDFIVFHITRFRPRCLVQASGGPLVDLVVHSDIELSSRLRSDKGSVATRNGKKTVGLVFGT